MTNKEAAFTLFNAGHSPSCPEIKAINVKAQTRANYYWEWKRGGGEAKVPAEALVVEGEGKFLMPGLSDMPMHLFGSENDLLLYLANGVTTIRDMEDGPPVPLFNPRIDLSSCQF